MLYEHFLLSQPPYARLLSLEETTALACERKEIEGAVLIANGPNGFHYANAFGIRSLRDVYSDQLLMADAIFWMAESSQFLIVVAALQCVERGLLDLDAQITTILPELKSSSEPKHDDSQSNSPRFSLRQLLIYNSFISGSTSRSNTSTHPSKTGTVSANCSQSLPFHWAQLAIERVTSSSLEAYCSKHIFTPLRMSSSTFEINQRPDLQSRVMELCTREGLIHPVYGTSLAPDGKLIPADSTLAPDSPTGSPPPTPTKDLSTSLYTSAPDFAKLLHSLCNNDQKLLLTESVNLLLTPQTQSNHSVLSVSEVAAIAGFPGVNISGGLGCYFVANPEKGSSKAKGYTSGNANLNSTASSNTNLGIFPDPGDGRSRRTLREGALFGIGKSNVHWWIDRRVGVSGVWATQLLPVGDQQCIELVGRFEESMYARAEGRDERV